MRSRVMEEGRVFGQARSLLRVGHRSLFAPLALGAILLVLVLVPAVASATQSHYSAGASFGGAGSGAGQLQLREAQFQTNFQEAVGGSSLAVDESTGDVYVADTENHRISEFDPAGTFVAAFGWGVVDGAAEAQVCTVVTGCRAGISGAGPGQLEAPALVAVDNSPGGEGDVYVGDTADATITKFTAAGTLVTSWAQGGRLVATPSSESFRPLDGIAVDGGDLLVFATSGNVYRFDRGGTIASQFSTPDGLKPFGMAVDAASDVFLVDGVSKVAEYSSTGASLGSVTRVSENGKGARIAGVAGSLADGALYADEEGAGVGAYAGGCEREGLEPDRACQPFQRFGEGDLHAGAGVAIDSATGTVYVASTEDERIVAFPVAIEATTGAAAAVTASGATLHGTVDPRGSALTICRFEYGERGAEGKLSVPCAESSSQIGEGTAPVPVQADVSGLQRGTTYRFRLRATNAIGDVKAQEGQFTTLASPAISGVEATGLEAGSATLRAQIDPGASEAQYHFEWGLCGGSCATSPYPESTPVGTIAANAGPISVSQAISALLPQATYHFRAVATNALGTTTSPEHTFIEQPASPVETGCGNEALRQADDSTALPDCRAYELVTPAQKNGSLVAGLLFGLHAPRIDPGGSSLTAPAVQCFAAPSTCIAHRGSEGETYQFSRGGDGWQTTPLAPPASLLQTHTWWSPGTEGRILISGPVEPGGPETFYLREPDGSFREVGPLGDRLIEGQPVSNSVMSVIPPVSTSDFSHIVYETELPTWSFDEGKPSRGLTVPSTYEFGPAANEPQLVGVSGAAGSTSLISQCGTAIGGSSEYPSSLYNSMSSDGRIVWFTAFACSTGTGADAGVPVPATELDERIDGGRTMKVSAPTPATCTTASCEGSRPGPANFEGAAEDGSLAVFTSTQKLTDEASEDMVAGDSATLGEGTGCARTSPSASGCNLYASLCPDHCELESTRRLIDLSAGAEGTGGPKVQGVVAISADGSKVYFVAKGVLTAEPDGLGAEAHEGADNLYLSQVTASQQDATLSFVAGLAAPDQRLWKGDLGHETTPSTLAPGLGLANITPDGRYLVFPSRMGLTPDAPRGEGAATQVYRFDADTATMNRISIGQAGYGDDGNAAKAGANASIVPADSAFSYGNGPARANPTVSDDGNFVFFQSPLALTPGALDEKVVEETSFEGQPVNVYAQNVYEWEEEGTGACTEIGGCVSLLSDGREAPDPELLPATTPELLGTDASGENVFIAAGDRLTWQDTDTQRDFYDLRVEGGFEPPAESPPCTGDGCKGAGTNAAAASSPATSTVEGPEEGPRHPIRRKHHKKKHHKKKHHTRKHHQRKDQHKKKGRRTHAGGSGHRRGGAR